MCRYPIVDPKSDAEPPFEVHAIDGSLPVLWCGAIDDIVIWSRGNDVGTVNSFRTSALAGPTVVAVGYM